MPWINWYRGHVFKLGLIISVLVLVIFLLSPAAICEENRSFCGVISNYEDDDGSITDAEMEINSLNDVEYYPIVLNDRTLKLVKDFADVPVEVTGSIIIEDEEEWLLIDSCLHVLIGTLQVTENEEGEIEAIKIQCNSPSFNLPINEQTKKCAEAIAGKSIRAVGLIDSNKKIFDLRDFREFVSGTGYLEIDEDEDLNVTSIRFVLLDDEGDAVQRYNIPLDNNGKKLAEQYAEEKVELTGMLQNDKSKLCLVVHTCDCYLSEDDEEWEEEELDDEEELDE